MSSCASSCRLRIAQRMDSHQRCVYPHKCHLHHIPRQGCNQTLWDALSTHTTTYHTLLDLKSQEYNIVPYLSDTTNVATVFAPTDAAMLSALRTVSGMGYTERRPPSTPVYTTRLVRGHRRAAPCLVRQCKHLQRGGPVQHAAQRRVEQGLGGAHWHGHDRPFGGHGPKLFAHIWHHQWQRMAVTCKRRPIIIYHHRPGQLLPGASVGES